MENRVILFADVHNFSIAAFDSLDGAAGLLQEMYTTLGDIIVAHRGQILKYMGDAIMCIFPAGSESEAVACALKLRQAFGEIPGWKGLPGRPELEVGIGSGPVTVGVFGHRSLQLVDAFGEEISRAATIGHHRGIAITEGVYNRLPPGYPTRRLPDKQVKWQKEPLKIWEVSER